MKLWVVILLLAVISAKWVAYTDNMTPDAGSDSGETNDGSDGTGSAKDEDGVVATAATTIDNKPDDSTEDEKPKTMSVGSKPASGENETTSASKNETAQRSLGPKKPRFFTTEWRELYSLAQIKNQAKWRLAEKQPEDGTYQTRIYPSQWWSTSHTPCEAENLASGSQYMNLYFFINGFNYQRRKYPLTYPVLFAVDKRPVPTQAPTTTPKRKAPPKRGRGRGRGRGGRRGGKGRRGKQSKPKKVCPVKYTTYFYLPIPLKKWAPKTQDKTIRSFKMPEEVYYVREYTGNYTTAYCGEQGRQLALDLLRNNVWTWETHWLCAKYEAPVGETEQKLEVWMKRRLQE